MKMITKEEALTLIRETSKYSHASLVSTIMRQLAERFGEDVTKWELVGLLHDLDFDLVTGDMAKHGILATQMLQGKLPEDSLHAIQSHDHRAGYRPTSLLDKALIVVDALVTSLKPHMNNIASITDIQKAIEDASNQKPWLKTLIQRCKELDMTREELFQITLNSL